jgi:tripartite-type tricarboxylate transporter receptor subunit TctC
MPHMKAGRIRALAVTTPEPSPLVPGLPSVSASGLPGYEYSSFIGFQAPGKTPPAIVNRLSEKIVQVLKSEDVRSRLLQSGVEAGGTTPEVLEAKIKAEIEQWRRIIKESGLRFE